jgi:hypothetical protein
LADASVTNSTRNRRRSEPGSETVRRDWALKDRLKAFAPVDGGGSLISAAWFNQAETIPTPVADDSRTPFATIKRYIR